MKTIYRFSRPIALILVLFIGFLCWAKVTSPPQPGVVAASGPATAPLYCLDQFSKRAAGKRSISFSSGIPCNSRTDSGATTIYLELSNEDGCNQTSIIPTEGRLEAEGKTTRRADGLAYFAGNFTIKDSSGATIFTGTIDLLDTIDTRRPSLGTGECYLRNRIEGSLFGRSSRGGGLAFPRSRPTNYTLQAFLVAETSLPTTATVSSGISGTLRGVVLQETR